VALSYNYIKYENEEPRLGWRNSYESRDHSEEFYNEYPYPPHSRNHYRTLNPKPFPKEQRNDLPPFYEWSDIHEFLDWEMKVEQIFVSHHVKEERKGSLATVIFQGQAMYWWSALLTYHEVQIRYCNELKTALRECHIPSYHDKEFLYQLHRFQQKDRTIKGMQA